MIPRIIAVLMTVLALTQATFAAETGLKFRIVEREQQKKGASLNPVQPPKYVLLVARAALINPPAQIDKSQIETTLRELLRVVRADAEKRREQVDGVTAFLYLSADHLRGDSAALGRAEWWPEGHTFDLANAPAIENKESHVETFTVLDVPEAATSVVSRLPEAKRREIFTALVRAQDRASREAEAKYPIDVDNLSMTQLRGYDFETAIRKNGEENDRLTTKYERELMRRYKISKEELDAISNEALAERWPLPPS